MGNHPNETLRRFEVVEAGTRRKVQVAVNHGEHDGAKPTRDDGLTYAFQSPTARS